MSKFAEKIMTGTLPTDDDWTEHIIEAHKTAPSMTPHAFAAYRTKSNLSSYEILAKQLDVLNKPDAKVLDLACGDGYLAQFILPKLNDHGSYIGIDMSDAELAIAKKNYSDKRVSFAQAKAQSLPLQDKSTDAIVCHLAFMLMLPLEPVVTELSRILKGGGLLSAVIGNPKGAKGFFAEIQKLTFQFLDARYPKIKEAKSGDIRAYSEGGLKSLFTYELEFDPKTLTIEDFELVIETDPTGVWRIMKDMYFIGILPVSEKQALKKEMESFAATNLNAQGKAVFEFPMTMFTVTKQPMA